MEAEPTGPEEERPHRPPAPPILGGAVHFYEILDVGHTVTDVDLRRAYRRLALRYHPDKQKTEADLEVAAAKFADLQRAYGVLSDPEKRQAYNDLVTAAWKVAGFC